MRAQARLVWSVALLGLMANGALAQCACSGWKDPFVGKPEAQRTAVWTRLVRDTGRMLRVWEDGIATRQKPRAVVDAAADTQSSWRSVLDCFAYHPPEGYAKDDAWFEETAKAAAAFDEAYFATRDGRTAAEILRPLREARGCIARLRQTNNCGTVGDAATLLFALLDGIEQQTVPDQLQAYSGAFGKQLAALATAPPPASAKGEQAGYAAVRAAAGEALERLRAVIDAGDAVAVKAAVRDARKAVGSLYERYGRDLT